MIKALYRWWVAKKYKYCRKHSCRMTFDGRRFSCTECVMQSRDKTHADLMKNVDLKMLRLRKAGLVAP